MKSNINVDQLGKINEKLRIYLIEEEILFSNVKSILNSINYNYHSNNTIRLEEIEMELLNKLDKINKNHNSDMIVIEKNINKYKDVNQKTEKIFRNLMEK